MTMSTTSTLTATATATATETLGNATVGEMFSDADMAEVRHVVQRILVPCVFVIGLLGNSVSIYVLTRKRMRCTTNIYLTALAITDIAYLTCQLILSLQHYDYTKFHVEIYWQLYGYFVWLCDSFGYISIYIAVCFTIERFIAIRYPLKRQTFCTESLAKKVIAAVAFFCLLSTLSTAFEHTITVGSKLIDDAYQPCNQTLANYSPMPTSSVAATPPLATPPLPTPATIWQSTELNTESTTTAGKSNVLIDWGSGSGDGEAENIPRHRRQWQSRGFVTLPTLRKTLEEQETDQQQDEEQGSSATESLLQLLLRSKRSAENNNNNNNNNINNTDAFAFNVTEYCQNVTIYNHGLSELGQDELYSNLWNMFTLLVFVVLPLLLLATFNSFLILLVHRSKNLRGDLTNASSIRRTKRKSNTGIKGSVSQENRVTITLIAVVLMFIVCQLPWAIYLVVNQYMDIQVGTQVVAGNVCNLLASLHAASNFFLYCVLSDKYRKTVRELITGYRYRRRHARNNTSLYVPHTTTTLTQINGDHYGSNYGGAGSRRNRNINRLIA
ncbi:uncharacterized protein LOC108110320 [Drosophila eugracilis]|uniref:uncharacterized protein LOC108110320 n=1 Tax=Drosophila eugracilis TaxID=29029 RepID=UPI0007E74093|nr:uncharacterized protein LOC108110320 [Drosophila eugracilis]XP_017074827.1 uncharacterized protein LOC108110320 [Drosophila eugracilis]XP_017074828.1 uncharacterized protein LOC108110320 [Drosophila eugracilis]XP_017074829.1 uncharacterized protein LOC108110320 [Drosophila eugracilis]XP_017074831.1 uncharacterized protein LOC108110320 [Drosophila eugracilis]XP_017074832.1 uncharacterized protein LOC108110320 [Drosophila eugracilis]XP_017074833.1 uncharacterized protein LOC108110320 [Drosop